jgi:hypothetical protein
MKVPVQHTVEEPSGRLQFSEGLLYQQWWIYEWGNKEGLGRAMNRRVEWRIVPSGPLPDCPQASEAPHD